MMVFFYRLSIFFYRIAIGIASLFNTKAKKWTQGRRSWRNQLSEKLKTNTAPIAWFHCASLGEFEQGRSLIERFRSEFPTYKIVLTFFSPSGYEIRKNYAQADHVFYLPLDTPSNARFFLDLVNPSIVFFIKYEFWYFFIQEIKKRTIPLISVSSIFRSNQLFFKSYGIFYRKALHAFSHFFVQNENSKKLLNEINIQSVTIAGDTRFDRVATIRESVQSLSLISTFKSKKNLFVIGSSWPADIEMLVPFIEQNPTLKFIIVPHEIHINEIIQLQKQFSLSSILYSQTKINPDSIDSFSILIIDEIGLLSSIYSYADYAYIGGGFGKGIHNILEAVVFGVPIFIGPRYQKFQEAVDLVKEESVFPISTSNKLITQFQSIQKNPSKKDEIKNKSLSYIKMKIGATNKIIDYLKTLL